MTRRPLPLLIAVLIGLTVVAGCGSAPLAPSASSHLAAASTYPADRSPGVTLPPAGARFSYQIGGPYPVPPDVRIVDRDRTEPAVPGRYSICYVNAFQAQPDALPWWQHNHPDLLLRHAGRLVMDAQWNEALLDLRHPAELLTVVGAWIRGCAQAGYRAVEADNLDSYTRSQGLLTRSSALAFGRLLAAQAHSAGLALGQKNAAELSPAARAAGFDFAIAEECQVYSECSSYTDVYGTELIEIEYTDQDREFFTAACAARGRQVSVVRRDRGVTPAGGKDHVEEWC